MPQGTTGLTILANQDVNNLSSPIDGISLYTTYNGGSGPPPGTPEPSSVLLMGLGAAALFGFARRRRGRSS